MTRPVYEYTDSYRKTYLQINELELRYQSAEGKEKYGILKKIILALCWMKDFLYAGKYVCVMETDFRQYGESAGYRKAMGEIREKMEECAKQKGKDVLFLHVVDSLADQVVDRMQWLHRHGRTGIRFRGITVQYPYTHYAMNTMFTGKSPFEIEQTTEYMEWDDSELLTFIHGKYTINAVSGNGHVMRQFGNINGNSQSGYPYLTLTEALFEGLALWGKRKEKNIILIHSCGEIHSSFLRTGAGKKLVLCKDMTDREQFTEQFQDAVEYTDEELQWYDSFYGLTGMPMILMGDHGVSMEAEYNYFFGKKQDMTRGIEEILTPAFIINRWKEDGREINGLIANTKIPQIIMAVLEDKTEGLDRLKRLERLVTETVELEFPPGYQEGYCERFMSRGIWGQYEGFAGIKTLNEIYLVSASGRELYFVPKEQGYRNLCGDASYREDMEKCKGRMGDYGFPAAIFRMEKYKKHLELLEKYDKECYRRIMAQTEGTYA